MNKSVFITGVSSGIGQVLLKRFIEQKCQVTVVLRREEQMKELIKLNAKNLNILIADLSKKNEVKELAQSLEGQRFDHVVLNAGIASYGKFDQLPVESIDHVVQTNLLANMYIVHAFLRTAKEQSTKFTFISSLAARLPANNFATYATTKAALSHFAQSLRREYKQHQFLIVEIGAVNTPLHEKASHDKVANEHFKPVQEIADKVFNVIEKKQGVVTLDFKWWLQRKIAMIADEILVRYMISKQK